MSELNNILELLNDKSSLKDVIAKVNELITKINETEAPKQRDRGPDSTRDMTDDDARKVMLGELKGKSHKDAATELGLSYGQIYSARKGFTFKGIYKEMMNPKAE